MGAETRGRQAPSSGRSLVEHSNAQLRCLAFTLGSGEPLTVPISSVVRVSLQD